MHSQISKASKKPRGQSNGQALRQIQDNSQKSDPSKCDCFDILLVDDENFNLIILINLLKKMLKPQKAPGEGQLVIEKAFNGQLAIDKLSGCCPEGHERYKRCVLVMTDLNMPVVNGFELAEHIRSKSPLWSVTLVANTAGLIKPKDPKYRDFDAFFIKPFNNDDIRKIMKRVFGPRIFD